jgi:hypothetical protein
MQNEAIRTSKRNFQASMVPKPNTSLQDSFPSGRVKKLQISYADSAALQKLNLYRLQWIYLNNSETKLTELKSAQF